MACNELAALRLGLMKVLNIDDKHEQQHEERDLGEHLTNPGPLQSLAQTDNLEKMQKFYAVTLVDLQEKVAKMDATDPKLPYHQSLILVTKKVEQELGVYVNNLSNLYNDLDDIHHLIYDVYPATS